MLLRRGAAQGAAPQQGASRQHPCHRACHRALLHPAASSGKRSPELSRVPPPSKSGEPHPRDPTATALHLHSPRDSRMGGRRASLRWGVLTALPAPAGAEHTVTAHTPLEGRAAQGRSLGAIQLMKSTLCPCGQSKPPRPNRAAHRGVRFPRCSGRLESEHREISHSHACTAAPHGAPLRTAAHHGCPRSRQAKLQGSSALHTAPHETPHCSISRLFIDSSNKNGSFLLLHVLLRRFFGTFCTDPKETSVCPGHAQAGKGLEVLLLL